MDDSLYAILAISRRMAVYVILTISRMMTVYGILENSGRMTVYDVYDTGNLGEMTVYVTSDNL